MSTGTGWIIKMARRVVAVGTTPKPLTPTQMVEELVKGKFFVRPNMSKTSSYEFVVLEKTDEKNVCIAQFKSEVDANLFIEAKRKQFFDSLLGK